MGDLAELFGAIIGTFLISRLFWVVTRSWPNSVGKALTLNVFCALVIIPLDYAIRANASLAREIIQYGLAQFVVLLIDLALINRRTAPDAGARKA